MVIYFITYLMNKNKIQTLRNILTEYSGYLKYFKNSKCYIRGAYIVIIFSGGTGYSFLKKRIPKRNIDKIIINYRAKLWNEKQKLLEKNVSLSNEITKADRTKKLKPYWKVYGLWCRFKKPYI